MRTHVCHGDVQKFAADIVKVDIQSVGGEPFDRFGHVLFLVVEPGTEAQLIDDEV